MANPRSQIPLKFEFLGRDGKVTQPWAFFLQTLDNALPPPGPSDYGYVIDGTASTTGPTTIFQGIASDRGSSPTPNSIYIADDTGEIFTVSGNQWQKQTPAITGDATKPAFSNVITLNNVNDTPGTFGDGSTIPVITVNEKGLVTNIELIPVAAQPLDLPGKIGDFIFKADAAGNAGAEEIYNVDTFTVSYTFNFAYADATPSLLFEMPIDRRILKASIRLEEEFTGSGYALSIGTLLNPELILPSSAVGPGYTGTFETDSNVSFLVNTEIYLFITPGTSTQGSGFVSFTLSN